MLNENSNVGATSVLFLVFYDLAKRKRGDIMAEFEPNTKKAEEFIESYSEIKQMTDGLDEEEKKLNAARFELSKFSEICECGLEYFKSKNNLEPNDPKNLLKNGAKFLKYLQELQAEKQFNGEMAARYPNPADGFKKKQEDVEKEIAFLASIEDYVVMKYRPAEKILEQITLTKAVNQPTEEQRMETQDVGMMPTTNEMLSRAREAAVNSRGAQQAAK